MISLFVQIFGIIGIFTLGLLVVNLLNLTLSFFEKIFLGYLLGVGIFTFVLFVSNVFYGFPFSLFNSFFILIIFNIVLLGVCVVLLKRNFLSSSDIESRSNSSSRFSKFVFMVVIFLLTTSFLSNLYWPVKTWDAIAVYDFRAISFVHTGFVTETVKLEKFTSYPLLTSLSHTWMYLIGFSNPKLIYFLFYASLVAVTYFILVRNVNKNLALFSVLIITVSFPIYRHSMIEYTNLPYTVYLVLGYFYLYEWIKKGESNKAILASILIGLSTWTRYQEPFWIPALFIIAGSFFSKKRRKIFFSSVFILVFYFTWAYFLRSIRSGGGGYLVGQNVSLFHLIFTNISFENISKVIIFLKDNVVKPYSLLLSGFILSTFTLNGKWKAEIMLTLVFITFLIMLFVGTYILSIDKPNSWSSIGNSTQRMVMFFIPYIIFYLTVVLEKFSNSLLSLRSKKIITS